MIEYRAVLQCSQDPCRYCPRVDDEPRPRQLIELNGKGPFTDRSHALAFGRGMATKVYGASVHRVLIQQRSVSAWVTNQ